MKTKRYRIEGRDIDADGLAPPTTYWLIWDAERQINVAKPMDCDPRIIVSVVFAERDHAAAFAAALNLGDEALKKEAEGKKNAVSTPTVSFAERRPDIEPCRACGTNGNPRLIFGALEPLVQCLTCGEPGPRCETEAEAIETWNRKQRKPMPDDESTSTFGTGAVRSSSANDYRYDLISPIGLRRLAETYAEGARKYGAGNWLKGFPASDLLNHLMRHVDLWRLGDRSEDHLAHAAWGLFALMHFDETRPELMDVSFAVEAQQP